MPRSRSKKMRKRQSRYIRHKGKRTHASRRIKRRRRGTRRQMRGGSNQWTCARKSSKDNKLYETISPGEKIQTLLSDNRFTSSRGAPPQGEYSEGSLPGPASTSKPKLPPRGPPPPGTLRRKSGLPKSQFNKEAIKRLDKSKKTTRKYIEDHLAKSREVIGDEHSAQNPGFNPDDPKS